MKILLISEVTITNWPKYYRLSKTKSGIAGSRSNTPECIPEINVQKIGKY
jgi:hypothetical protein